MSLLQSLSIGNSGLAASQVAINVTGQNIANANTEGYSRKRLDLAPGQRRDSTYGEMGFGVDIKSITRIKDIFIDQQLAEQTTQKGYFTTLDDALERVENIFAEPSDQGLNQTLNNFWDAWQDLGNNPSDLSAREVVRSNALVLTDTFHSLSQEMSDYQLSRNDELEAKVKQINGLSREIYNLNLEIAAAEIDGKSTANDSRDRRDQLIQKMSSMVDVTFVEDINGMITLTTGGNIIVGPTSVTEIEMSRQGKLNENLETESKVILRFADSKKEYKPLGGEVKGILDVRDKVMPEYITKLDDLAKAIVTSVNEIHKGGYNLNHNTGVLFFDEKGLKANSFNVSAAILSDAKNIAGAEGGTSVGPIPLASPADFAGIPASASPTLNLKSVQPVYRNIVKDSVTITLANGVRLEEGSGKDYVVDYENGLITFINYSRYAAGDNVNIDFRYSQAGYPGDGNGGNAINISKLRSKSTMSNDALGTPSQSIAEYYSSFIGNLGIQRNQANSNMQTRKFLATQLQNQQSALSGVSIDEEMANMIKFEHSYQASARYMSTISNMLDVLMNM